jgi:hypothetical protein
MGTVRLGNGRKDATRISVRSLTPIEDVVFGGWDIFEDSAYGRRKARVLNTEHLAALKRSWRR